MKRTVGPLALLSWLALPFLFWQAQQVRPRLTRCHQLARSERWLISRGSGKVYGTITDHDQRVQLWDMLTGEKRREIAMEMGANFGAYYAAQSEHLILIDAVGTVSIWDSTTGKKVASSREPAGMFLLWALAPDGRTVPRIREDGEVQLWDLSTGQVRATFPTRGSPHIMAFSPDGKLLAIAEPDGTVAVWDVETQQRVQCFPGEPDKGEITLATYTPDGHLVVTRSGDDETFRLWDLTDRRELAHYRLSEESVNAFCLFSVDGSKWLVQFRRNRQADLLGTISAGWAADLVQWLFPNHEITIVFDVATGRELARVPHNGEAVVLSEENMLATFSNRDDQFVIFNLWDLPPQTTVHPLVAWTVLALAVVLSTAWWYLGRKGKAAALNHSSGTG